MANPRATTGSRRQVISARGSSRRPHEPGRPSGKGPLRADMPVSRGLARYRQTAGRSYPRCLLCFRVPLDRCKRRWDAFVGEFEPIGNLSLSVGAEAFLEHRYATR